MRIQTRQAGMIYPRPAMADLNKKKKERKSKVVVAYAYEHPHRLNLCPGYTVKRTPLILCP